MSSKKPKCEQVKLDEDNIKLVRKFCEENGFNCQEGVNLLLRDFCAPCLRCNYSRYNYCSSVTWRE